MTRTVLLTGASGALGPHLLTELLRCDDIQRVFALVRGHGQAFDDRVRDTAAAVSRLASESDRPVRGDRLQFVAGDVCDPRLFARRRDGDMLVRDVDVVVHAAADTSLTGSVDRLRAVNVGGTRHAVDFAGRCRSLRELLLVSTVCVAGTRTGSIPECLEDVPPPFVNAYEQTKWEAEHIAAASSLPVRIARLSVCMGGQDTGYVHRFGAMHHALHWLMRGLIPMMPGAPGSRIDVIANDVAARWIARAALRDVETLDVCHVASGCGAPALDDLLKAAVERLRCHAGGRPFDKPLIVDRQTFELFRDSVQRSGDALFTRVLQSAAAFLPLLLYSKVFETERAERCWGGPLPHPEWRSVLGRVIDFGCAHDWKCVQPAEAAHV